MAHLCVEGAPVRIDHPCGAKSRLAAVLFASLRWQGFQRQSSACYTGEELEPRVPVNDRRAETRGQCANLDISSRLPVSELTLDESTKCSR
jgi:hypothetical protein